MKRLISVLAVAAIVSVGAHYLQPSRGSSGAPGPGSAATAPSGSAGAAASSRDPISSAFADHRGGVEVTGQGTVTRVLSDDRNGSPHQRFILRLPSGQTLLIAHNIALAERIPSLKEGDIVQFKGEYEWNAQGGVIHWTHDDPRGRHAPGWLKHDGRSYH